MKKLCWALCALAAVALLSASAVAITFDDIWSYLQWDELIAAVSETVTSGDYEYRLDGEMAVIAAYNGDDTRVEIPSSIDGHPVSEVGAEAFRYKKLKRVTIPEGVRSIGRQAFEYCDITDALLLPESIVIARDAFSYAQLPATVTIPAGATVEACAFSYCEALERVVVGPGAWIKGRAFGYCDGLKQAVIAEGVRLEDSAFEYCRRLERATLCGAVKMDRDAFSYCKKLEVTRAEAGEYDALRQAALDGSLGGGDSASDAPSERALDIINSPAELDGVTAELETATAVLSPGSGGYSYSFTGALENHTDEGIMQVIYTFTLLDEGGEAFRTFSKVYDGEDEALPPHTRMGFTHDGIKWGKQSVPAAVEIGISSVKTEAELPPAHVPETGDLLFRSLGDAKLANILEDKPAELSFHVDQGGYGRTATLGPGEALDRAVELFCAIRIGEESNEWVTDNYNWIGFTWADGSHTGISLNLDKLEYSIHSSLHVYELENLGPFWSYCADYLEEDQ